MTRLSTRHFVTDLFVDTGAFYAAADLTDTHHAAAVRVFGSRGTQGELVTTDHVVLESWFLLRARLGRAAAMLFWDAMETGVVRVLGVTSEDFGRGRSIAREWSDQDFSIVDCTSFAILERTGVEEAFAFDRHFRVYRFGRARRRALHIVP
jgi:predicted nucleic acid-binding protein